VREGWLVQTLLDEHRDASTYKREVTDLFVWRKFRFALARHRELDEVALFGPPGLDTCSSRLRAVSPKLFWEITGEVLAIEHDQTGAKMIDDLLDGLLRLDDSSLRDLCRGLTWPGLQRFLERVQSYAP
jgi:hypothetical protein